MGEAVMGTAASPAMLIRLLGRFTVTVEGREIVPEGWGSHKAQQLVKLLALAPEHRLARDQIIDALWPESDPDAVANTFYQTLYYARRTLDPARRGFLVTRQGIVALRHPGGVAVDLHRFQETAARALRGADPAPLAAALALYGGELLPDDRYEDWSAAPREAALRTYLDTLHALGTLQAARGDAAAAIATFGTLLDLDPAHEETHLAIMRLHAAAGRRKQALGQFHRLREALRDLNAAPDVASQQLYATILAGAEESEAEASQPVRGARRHHNLPAPLTELIGREAVLADLAALLAWSDHLPRLVTLTGAGGCGKTRLALALAHEVAEAYPDGVWYVELDGLADGELVPQAIARAVGVQERPERTSLAALVDHLRDGRALIVLDNCEHLLAACAAAAAALLTGCAAVQVLATSQAPLRVAGEVAWRVPSLPVPPPLGATSLEATFAAAAQSPAVQLFAARARQARPDFALDGATLPPVVAICRRLEGLPLALELAAAWVPVLTLDEIAARLGRALLVLTSGARSAPSRHQTLRATIEWGYRLLPAPARTLLARLAVFQGGWTLAAAEALGDEDAACAQADTMTIATDAILPLLALLVEHSLVLIESVPEGLRYRFLEPVRQYAAEQLGASGAAARWHERHARHFLAVAEEAEAALSGPTQGRWLARLERDEENIRAALRWWADQGAAEPGLRLAAALGRFWQTGNRMREGRGWLTEAFAAHQAAAPAAVRAKALNRASILVRYLGDLPTGRAMLESALALFRELGDEEGECDTLMAIGTVAHRQGDPVAAGQFYAQAREIATEIGDRRQAVIATSNLAALAYDRREFARASAAYAVVLEQVRELGDPALLRTMPLNLALSRIAQGETAGVRALLAESLAQCAALHDWAVAPFPVLGLALLANLLGQPERGARLLGASEGIRAVADVPLPSAQAPFANRAAEEARAALGEAAFAALVAEGRRWTVEQTIAEAHEPW
jgi:predicted ATPase/DNA-binding SARP family transcriptional activator